MGTQKTKYAIKDMNIKNGVYIQVNNKGTMVAYAIISNYKQRIRIDSYGCTPHRGVLPHIHYYHYSDKGPDGEIVFDIAGNIIDLKGKFKK